MAIRKKNLKQITLVGIDGKGCETDQIDFILRSCMKYFNFGSVVHVSGGSVSCEYMGINRIGVSKMSVSDYNRFCLYGLPDLIETKYCLIVHTDGFIINPHLWDDVFLEYDYIGAPWYMPCTKHWKNLVGNGGFSLRSRKFLDYSKSFVDYDGKMNEDIFLCVENYEKALKLGIKIADLYTSARFSIETLSNKFPAITNSFGFHGKSNLPVAMNLLNKM